MRSLLLASVFAISAGSAAFANGWVVQASPAQSVQEMTGSEGYWAGSSTPVPVNGMATTIDFNVQTATNPTPWPRLTGPKVATVAPPALNDVGSQGYPVANAAAAAMIEHPHTAQATNVAPARRGSGG